MSKLIVNEETVTLELEYFKDLLKKYQELSELVQQVQNVDNSEEQKTESLWPKLEFPDWICGKQDFCITTPGNKHWNIRECNVEAELVCVSYGIKYGTPATMSPGRCENLYPDGEFQ
ncbi:hypothetical protein H7992_14435 [Sporosarcina sp. resist]|uniref:hypothetical protein n=1 Tax=Sporosarcina sp. resist TaxID=2762563 RepID=UPI00164E534E|nr:hypothetical protein [Sporosarcina sp. resist]QNK86457.1 hypothetical protein H7992_14435 [Sporosarcina sp. resist]